MRLLLWSDAFELAIAVVTNPKASLQRSRPIDKRYRAAMRDNFFAMFDWANLLYIILTVNTEPEGAGGRLPPPLGLNTFLDKTLLKRALSEGVFVPGLLL